METNTLSQEIKSFFGPKEVLLILLSIAFLLIVSNLIINGYMKRKVQITSKRYLYLKEFYDNLSIERLDSSYKIYVQLKSKPQYDHLSFERIMEFFTIDSDRENLIITGKRNQNALNRFIQEEEHAPPPVTREQLMGVTRFKSKYIRTESMLISSLESKLKSSVPTYTFIFTYTSPQGRNSYSREYSPDIDTLVSIINKNHAKGVYRTTAQYQRSLMSPSLRYKVMQRDGFRCVICGRNASDGVQLHVDHIKPVSKGGKTELGNLRTLCQDCNIGKGSKYNPNGPN